MITATKLRNSIHLQKFPNHRSPVHQLEGLLVSHRISARHRLKVLFKTSMLMTTLSRIHNLRRICKVLNLQ